MTSYEFLIDRADLLREMAEIERDLIAFAAQHGEDDEAQDLRRRLLAARNHVVRQLAKLAGPVADAGRVAPIPNARGVH